VKVLLDNCVNYRAKAFFHGHEVLHARDVGWRHLLNGVLLVEAAKRFEVLATVDKNIRHQHNLINLPIAVLELNTHFTRLKDLTALAPHLDRALAATKDFLFVSLSPDGTLETLAPRPRPAASK
jgi:hypothetical protein